MNSLVKACTDPVYFTELVVRTTHLMLAVEKSLIEHESNSSKAMIFGSFATARARDE